MGRWLVKKTKQSHKRKRRAPAPRRPSQNVIMCALCDQPMGTEERWVGDIEAAVSFRDVPPQGEERQIHKSCGEFATGFVKDAMQKRNRRRPGLRLCPYPWSSRCAPASVPIPNLNICAEYFDKYESALQATDALQQISDLLLEFRREHFVEWECSGWKNDAIADLVLGRTLAGYSESGSVFAQTWLTQHWKYEKSVDRQIAITFSADREKASNALFELELLHVDGSYNTLARFVSWLNENAFRFVHSQAAATQFFLKNPSLMVKKKVLIELAYVYGKLTERPMYRGDRLIRLQASMVIQEYVAQRHRISSRSIAQVRAESKKSSPRNQR